MWMASAAKNVSVSFTVMLPSNERFEISEENQPFFKHVSKRTGQGMKYLSCGIGAWTSLKYFLKLVSR